MKTTIKILGFVMACIVFNIWFIMCAGCNDPYLNDEIPVIVAAGEEESYVEEICTITRYNPTESQCDSTPLETADGSKINLGRLKNGTLKWVAVSRDLLEKFPYGSRVEILGAGDIDGIYEVHDTMHPRFRNHIDILTAGTKAVGKWEDIQVLLVKE